MSPKTPHLFTGSPRVDFGGLSQANTEETLNMGPRDSALWDDKLVDWCHLFWLTS